MREERVASRATRAEGCRPCTGYPYILFNHGVPLDDQVEQANLLDALHVPWRSGGCL
jgi:hypothetical protein